MLLVIIKRKRNRLILLGEGAFQAPMKHRPIRRRPHERQHRGDMLIQLDIAGIGGEPLVMLVLARAIRHRRVFAPQLSKDPWR